MIRRLTGHYYFHEPGGEAHAITNRSVLTNVIAYLRRSLGDVPADRTDADLLAAYLARRDDAAFAALVARHGALVWHACRRVLGVGPDAEDAFQATFLVLARRAGQLRHGTHLAAWLHAVAVRTAQKARTMEARRTYHERKAATMRTSKTEPREENAELLERLDVELMRLPLRYRIPILLCHLQNGRFVGMEGALPEKLTERWRRPVMLKADGQGRYRLRTETGPASLGVDEPGQSCGQKLRDDAQNSLGGHAPHASRPGRESR